MNGWRKEFPNFPEAGIPALPQGFEDTSWHNDACPSFTNKTLGLVIWVDYPDAAEREHPDSATYSVRPESETSENNDEGYLDTDDWSAVLDFIKEREAGMPDRPCCVGVDYAYNEELQKVLAALEKHGGKIVGFLAKGQAGGNPSMGLRFPTVTEGLAYLNERYPDDGEDANRARLIINW